MQMWEPFSEPARSSIVRAQEAAIQLGQNYIGCEHLLLGVIALPGTAGARLVQACGIDLHVLKDKIEGTLRRKEAALHEMVFTPRAKRAIELAFQEAHELHDTYIGTEHLLLGIVAESESHAAQALLELGASRDALKAKLTDEIREETPTAKHGDAFIAYDHVQLAMPAGREAEARDFYVNVLGMSEIPKPSEKAVRGGVWFRSGTVQLHLGVDPDFHPAQKAHPALRCADFPALVKRLQDASISVQIETESNRRSAYVHDPFGNRIELMG